MTEESLLTDDVRATIGKTSEPVTVRVTPRALGRAIDVYWGAHGDLPAEGEPVPGVVLAALEGEPESLDLPDLMPDGLLISNEWQLERPLRMGEQLTAQSRLADIYERFGGRFGYSIYFRSDVEFRDAEGRLVARSGRTMMQYDARNAREGEDEA